LMATGLPATGLPATGGLPPSILASSGAAPYAPPKKACGCAGGPVRW
jgi:hypothetical protein